MENLTLSKVDARARAKRGWWGGGTHRLFLSEYVRFSTCVALHLVDMLFGTSLFYVYFWRDIVND